jgi:hypothetical protein
MEQCGDLPAQVGELALGNVPDKLIVNIGVTMNQDVAKSDDLPVLGNARCRKRVALG